MKDPFSGLFFDYCSVAVALIYKTSLECFKKDKYMT